MSAELYEWVVKQRNRTPRADYGPIWESNTKTFDEDFAQFGGNHIAQLKNMIATRRDYTVFSKGPATDAVCRHYLEYLERIRFDTENAVRRCPEVDFVPSDMKSESQFGPVSNDLLRKFCYLDIINRHVPANIEEKQTFLEIGGGIGSLARIIQSRYTNCRYFIFDLPESLFYSFTYLNAQFPGKVHLIDEDSIADIAGTNGGDPEFFLVPSYLRSQLPDIEIDVVLNTASLGEMTSETCWSWFEFINKNPIKHVFLLNRYLNNWHLSGKTGNYCSLLLDKSWDIKEWHIDPDFLKSPVEEMEPNYLLIVAEKSESPSEESARRKAAQYLERAESSFFVKVPLRRPDTMKARYHRPLFGGKGGPLHHFWEACRLDPEPNAIRRHVEFLRAWGPADKYFEEIYAYISLLLLKKPESFAPIRQAASIWLWGAGSYGEMMHQALLQAGIPVFGVFDGTKTGSWMGFDITPANQMADVTSQGDIILVTSNAWEEMVARHTTEKVPATIMAYGDLFADDNPLVPAIVS